MSWEAIAAAYFGYLLAVALARPAFSRARRAALAIGVAVSGVLALTGTTAECGSVSGLADGLLWPAAILVLGYWASGRFFVQSMEALERVLRDLDERILVRTGLLRRYQSAPRAVRESVELSYLLVYFVVPAGALTLLVAGAGHALDRFWAVVLLAGFTCYAMLPWVQTRPPRVLESNPSSASGTSLARRVNEVLLRRASIQANTVPSGHAAVALATALAVSSALPAAGVPFFAAATGIIIATVAGRYHYVLDSALGALVGVLAWLVVGQSR